MANTISPNMLLVIPGVGTEAGPQYAFDVNTSLTLIDQHDHSPGKGIQITPAGININAALNFNDNPATSLSSVVFVEQASPSTILGSVSVAPGGGTGIGDLYYTDFAGNTIQITKSGQVNVVASSIPGESYSSGTFIWTQTQSGLPTTPANFDIGSITLRPNIAATTVGTTLVAPTSGDYTINLPIPMPEGDPGVPNFVTMTGSGQQANTYYLDNVTLDTSGNAIQVAPGGITTTQISPTANITGSQLSPTAGILQSQLAASAFEWQSQTVTNVTPSFAVRAATNVNGTLATSFANGSVIDGVTLATGNIILIKNQTNSPDDGVYVVNASGNPTRDASYSTFTELNYAGVTVTAGTVNAGTSWFQNNILTSLASAQSWSQSETTQFIVPTGVNTLFVIGTGGGGGGGGGGSNSGSQAGSGGGGGAGATPFFNVLSVNPGDTLSVTSGFGGPGGAANTAGTNGEASSIFYSGNVVAYYSGASGGNHGSATNTPTVAVSTFSNSVFAGVATTGGAGGGGATNDASLATSGTIGGVNNYVGTSAANGTISGAFSGLSPSGSGGGGGAGTGMGGAGGNGYGASTAGSAGSAGSNYGSGGGGGGGGQGTTPQPAKVGGNGANGAVIIYWQAGA